jgi:hypothetical protein
MKKRNEGAKGTRSFSQAFSAVLTGISSESADSLNDIDLDTLSVDAAKAFPGVDAEELHQEVYCWLRMSFPAFWRR